MLPFEFVKTPISFIGVKKKCVKDDQMNIAKMDNAPESEAKSSSSGSSLERTTHTRIDTIDDWKLMISSNFQLELTAAIRRTDSVVDTINVVNIVTSSESAREILKTLVDSNASSAACENSQSV